MKIHIIGWSGVNHSYSIIAEDYIKGLMQYSENTFKFTPYKFYVEKWEKYKTTIFDNMQQPTDEDEFDITIKFVYPYDFIPDSRSKVTIVFVTCEFNYINDFVDIHDICDNVFILTPSEFSKKGIIASEIIKDKIIVIPHSYDYENIKYNVEKIREKYKIPINDYVFFHNSSLTPNKNFSAILSCFNAIYNINKNITLLVKGSDSTYNSKDKLTEIIQMNQIEKKINCESKIQYIGKNLSLNEISELYELSDCYISPFLAEGFNLPILEALCHGKRVICTRGGPPDEFAKDGIFIKSKEIELDAEININGNMKHKKCLMPDTSDLLKKMILVMYSTKIIDKKYYINNYSCMEIGKKLQQNMLNLLEKTYNNIQIVLIFNNNIIKIKQCIKNIRIFSGNAKIFIGYVEDQMEELSILKKNDKYIETVNINDNKNIIMQIKEIMKKKYINETIFVGDFTILFVDPRNFYVERGKCNKIFYGENRRDNILVAYINQNCTRTEYEHLPTFRTMLKKDYKWCDKKNKTKVLYIMNNDDNLYKKVYAVENSADENIDEIILQYEDTKMTIAKFLGMVNVSILTENVYEKYKNIFRSSPLTILFEERKILNEEDCLDLNKKNIFVYPESLNYFFAQIYPHLRIKFKLFTFECEFTANEKYKIYDTMHKIISCEYIKN